MDPESLDVAARLAATLFGGRVLASVRPVERDGLRLAFEGARLALVLSVDPAPGWLVPVAGTTGRVRGGRGAWPDAAGLADRELAGRRLLRVVRAPAERSVALCFEGDAAVELRADRRGPRVLVRLAGGRPRVLPEGAEEPDSGIAPDAWSDVEDSGCAEESGAPELAARLESDWRERREAERFSTRRELLDRALKREVRRLRRAREAMRRDERDAAEPAEARRSAEALLSAGPRAERRGSAFVVPDPYDPAREIEIAAEPPGARPHEVAERLFRRARRAERGRVQRAARDARLAEREAKIDDLRARALEATSLDDLDVVVVGAVDAGLALSGASRPTTSVRRRRGPEERPARAYRSPAGLEVLAGRSARQNDELTFRVASPDDLWLHVRDRPGAHVVVRAGRGREIPEADVLFAARIAAAFCRAPEGELVEVHVARRKHVRKPRGAAPGQVLVRRSRTVSVRVGPVPE